MASSQDVYGFLTGLSNRNLTVSLAEPDLVALEQAMLIQRVSADQYTQMNQEVQAIGADRAALLQEQTSRAQLAGNVQSEEGHTHSILFHFENAQRRTDDESKAAQDEASLRSMDADLTAKIQAFNALVSKQSALGGLVPYSGGYVGLTSAGVLQQRQMGIRMYRVSDLPFSAYWAETQQVTRDLVTIADTGGRYVSGLSGALATVDRGYLWSIGIGLAKALPDASQGGPAFLNAYQALGALSGNDENRLMAAEILSSARGDLNAAFPSLRALESQVRGMGVPKESSLGVASVLLLGQRADGTFATDSLATYLRMTRSFESAALLAIVNAPIPEISQKFSYLRSLFASWGYAPSEDVELSSAYIAVSDLPIDGVQTKLAIIARGLGQYLQYPLVAASILAAVPVMEANESLALLEQAYGIIGARAMPLTPPELICLAVRMVHGVRPQTIQSLDTTATAQPAAPVRGGYFYGPGFFFVPVFVAHGAYYSTFSGVGGAHPGHAHFGTGGFAG